MTGRLQSVRGELASLRAIPNLWRYWLGQLASEVGSEATTFVLLTYVYVETGSLVQFALLFALDNVPDLFLTPVAGVLVDRHDRRLLHIVGDGGVALVTVAALGLWAAGGLSVPLVYGLVVAASCFEVIQGAAAEAMYQEMVPPEKLVRTGAVLGTFDEVVEVAGPAIGITLYAVADAGAVFALDLATFAIALYTLATLSQPEVFRAHLSTGTADGDEGADDDDDDEGSFRFFWQGVRFLGQSPAMGAIFVYSVVDGFLMSLVLLVTAAAAMELGGEAALAVVQSAAGIGTMAGLTAVALFGLRRAPVVARNVITPGLAVGLVLAVGALGGRAWTLAGAALVIMALSVPLDATLEATSLAAIPKPLMGRVTAVFDLAGGAGNLVLLLGVAPLIEYVLEPAVASGRLPLGPVGRVLDPSSGATPLLLVLAAAGLAYLALNAAAGLSRSADRVEEMAARIAVGPAWAGPVAPDPQYDPGADATPDDRALPEDRR